LKEVLTKTGVGPVRLQEQFVTLGPLVALDPLLNKVKFAAQVLVVPLKLRQVAANGAGQGKQVLFPMLNNPAVQDTSA